MMTSSTKVVRCLIQKSGSTTDRPDVRIIPCNEFELWKYMMTRQYGFTVSQETIYLFLTREEFTHREKLYSHLPRFEVNRITLYFFLKADQVLVPVIRYFPLDEYDRIRPIYLKHFQAFEDRNHAAKVLEEIIEERGVCVRNLWPGEERAEPIL